MLKLLMRQSSPSCAGPRLFQHPAWAQFRRVRTACKETLVEVTDTMVEQRFRGKNYHQLPPVEIPYRVCEGTSKVDRTMSAQDLAIRPMESDDYHQHRRPG